MGLICSSLAVHMLFIFMALTFWFGNIQSNIVLQGRGGKTLHLSSNVFVFLLSQTIKFRLNQSLMGLLVLGKQNRDQQSVTSGSWLFCCFNILQRPGPVFCNTPFFNDFKYRCSLSKKQVNTRCNLNTLESVYSRVDSL